MGTHNRSVKFGLKIPNRLRKMPEKNQGGGILIHVVLSVVFVHKASDWDKVERISPNNT